MNSLISNFLKTRKQTLKLVSNLDPEDMVVQSESFTSPIKWHLGHTTWFFEKFILSKQAKYSEFDKSFNFIFNSYYDTVGEYNPKKKRGLLNRPLLKHVLNYRQLIDNKMVDLFNKKKITNKIKFLVELGINHEQQHQELILMDFIYNFFSNPLKQKFIKKSINKKKIYKKIIWECKKKISFDYGTNGNLFHYDNESPTNKLKLNPFTLNIDFVSNNQWKEFIECNGYKRPELWLSDGWEFIKKNNISRPLYWIDKNHKFSLYGVEKIDGNQPVSNISFYEADAFCRFKKKRLPSEFELEFFLKNNQKSGNFLENNIFKEITISHNDSYKNAYGNLWCWTSSNYLPYSGYKPFEENLAEYNQKFMCNQFVLKGGSFSTPKNHVRPSYRNFYYPSDRWQFSGLRLVDDI